MIDGILKKKMFLHYLFTKMYISYSRKRRKIFLPSYICHVYSLNDLNNTLDINLFFCYDTTHIYIQNYLSFKMNDIIQGNGMTL